MKNAKNYPAPPATVSPATAHSVSVATAKRRDHVASNPEAEVALSALQQSRRSLPIYTARTQLINQIRGSTNLVIVGETGSGKTTQIPQYIYEAGILGPNAIVAITQPRRVAATSIAARVAQEMGGKLGEKVGYSIRFDDCTSSETQIKYMTDGMLLREFLNDPLIRKYKVVILDECHERTLRNDILLGMLKGLQKTGKRPDLKIIAMSATLNADQFASFLDAPVLYVAGRQYPVSIYHTEKRQSDYLDAVYVTLFQIHRTEPPGDILVFLTGQEEIESLAELMESTRRVMPPDIPDLLVLPLYAALPASQQSSIFGPTPPGTRKVVLATNIAETSITIPNIRYVIDAGLSKTKSYQARLLMDTLEVMPISQSAARQRAGRAGRDGPGVCYRVYTEQGFQSLDEETDAEIKRCNLASVVLLLFATGVTDIMNFDFLEPPPRDALRGALAQLLFLGAFDSRSGSVTPLGIRMAEFPLDPPLARVLIASADLGCTSEVIDILSLLSMDSVFYAPVEKREQAAEARHPLINYEGDHLTLLKVMRDYLAAKDPAKFCTQFFVSLRSMRQAADIRQQLREFTAQRGMDPDLSCDGMLYTESIIRCFLSGFSNNMALLQTDGRYQTVQGQHMVQIHPTSVLFGRKTPCVFYNEMIHTTRTFLRGVSAVHPDWLDFGSMDTR